jgi:hypothetical protein
MKDIGGAKLATVVPHEGPGTGGGYFIPDTGPISSIRAPKSCTEVEKDEGALAQAQNDLDQLHMDQSNALFSCRTKPKSMTTSSPPSCCPLTILEQEAATAETLSYCSQSPLQNT